MTEKMPENAGKFVCNYCDFKCYTKTDWKRHLTRPKHTNQVFGNTLSTKKHKKLILVENAMKYIKYLKLYKNNIKL